MESNFSGGRNPIPLASLPESGRESLPHNLLDCEGWPTLDERES
jgi:hypothetical protein